MPDLAYKKIAPYLSDFMGQVFEEICKQYMWKQLAAGDFSPEFTDIGRWWGNDPKKRKMAEIDILGTVDNNTAIFGECKWRNESTDISVLETLVERSELFPQYKNKYFILFSKSGFTQGCIDKAAEMGNVQLVGYADMY